MKTRVKGINLLPREYIIAEKIKLGQMIISAALALEVVCFVAFFAIPPKQEIEATRQELEAKQREVVSDKYAGVNKTLNDLEVAKADMTKWNNEYHTIKQESYINGQLLDELVGRVPRGVNISMLSIDNPTPDSTGAVTRTLSIDAQSNTFMQSLNFVSVLETLFPAESIIHETNPNEETGKYDLQITIKLVISGTQAPVEVANVGEAATTEGEEATVQ